MLLHDVMKFPTNSLKILSIVLKDKIAVFSIEAIVNSLESMG